MKKQKIYLMGICGTAMGALAGLLKERGHEVVGSDADVYPPMSDMLQSLNILILSPFSASNMEKMAPDAVVVGNVISKTNPEVAPMIASGRNYLSLPAALQKWVYPNSECLVVTGTHGKTTTSAILAHALEGLSAPVGFMIGGIPLDFGRGYRCPPEGKSHFVIEGDEYDTAFFEKSPKFLHYRPASAILTSIEFDHGDIYENLGAIKREFLKFIGLIPPSGFLVANIGDENVRDVLKCSNRKCQLITYGTPEADYPLPSTEESHGLLSLDIASEKKAWNVQSQLSGKHNALNLTAVFALLRALGFSGKAIAEQLSKFHGVKRRMEVIGREEEVVVVDDFAHHPTAVKTTLEGARARYPDHEIWALFEPRSATSSTNLFQSEYASSFGAADRILFAPVGRKKIANPLNIQQLAKELRQRGKYGQACGDIGEMIRIVKEEHPRKAVLLCMSNGGFGGIHQGLLKALKEKKNEI